MVLFKMDMESGELRRVNPKSEEFKKARVALKSILERLMGGFKDYLNGREGEVANEKDLSREKA